MPGIPRIGMPGMLRIAAGRVHGVRRGIQDVDEKVQDGRDAMGKHHPDDPPHPCTTAQAVVLADVEQIHDQTGDAEEPRR